MRKLGSSKPHTHCMVIITTAAYATPHPQPPPLRRRLHLCHKWGHMRAQVACESAVHFVMFTCMFKASLTMLPHHKVRTALLQHKLGWSCAAHPKACLVQSSCLLLCILTTFHKACIFVCINCRLMLALFMHVMCVGIQTYRLYKAHSHFGLALALQY